MDKVKEPTVIFSGSARDAVRLFPKNINVAATVALLGVGFDRTKVKIVLDPASHSNSHELRIRGEFGEMTCHTYNVPSPDPLRHLGPEEDRWERVDRELILEEGRPRQGPFLDFRSDGAHRQREESFLHRICVAAQAQDA